MNNDIVYRDFDPDIFVSSPTAVIDADGFAWAIGWNNKDSFFEDKVRKDVDLAIHDILQGIRAQHYVGILSPAAVMVRDYQRDDHERDEDELVYTNVTKPNFRNAIAKTKPYKGQRPEKPEWYTKWAPVVEARLVDYWGFIRTPEGFEADDLVCSIMANMTEIEGAEPWCCGTDKDLLQIPGKHFNIVKKTITELDYTQAQYKLWTQCLCGDTTDNIAGLEKCGPVGAKKILEGLTPDNFPTGVIEAFIAKHGQDKGIQLFYENYMLVKLRHDIDTSEIDGLRGYDLEEYANFGGVAPTEEAEDVPDFGG